MIYRYFVLSIAFLFILFPSTSFGATIFDWSTSTPTVIWNNLKSYGQAQYIQTNEYTFINSLDFRLWSPGATTTDTLSITVYRCPTTFPVSNYHEDCSMVTTYAENVTVTPTETWFRFDVAFQLQADIPFVLVLRSGDTGSSTDPLPIWVGSMEGSPYYPFSFYKFDGIDDYDYVANLPTATTTRMELLALGAGGTSANSIVFDVYDGSTDLGCTVHDYDIERVCNYDSIATNATIRGTTTVSWNRYTHRTELLNRDLLPVFGYGDNQYVVEDFIVDGSPTVNFYHEIPFPNAEWTVGNTYYIRSCIISAEEDAGGNDYKCAQVFFGNGLDATSTQAIKDTLPSTDVGDPPIQPGTGTDCGSEYNRTWLACEMMSYARTILTVFPLGYFTEPIIGYVTYKNTHATTSTSTHFIVGFNVAEYFDSNTGLDPEIPAITTTWDLTTASQGARTWSPDLINTVEEVLWAVFMIYLAWRIYAGVWQQGISGGVDWYTDRQRYVWRKEDNIKRANMRR